MKKIFVTLVAAIGLAVSANAQFLNHFTFGAKAGVQDVNITNVEVHGLELGGAQVSQWTDPMISFNAGVFAEYKFNRWIGVSPEIIYSAQGAKITETDWIPGGPSSESAGDLHLNYINVPILAKIYPLKWLSVDLGPQIGFLASAKTKDTEVPQGEDKTTTDVKKSFNSTDFSLAMGLTFNFTKNVFMWGRYNMGLTEVAKSSESHFINSGTHANDVIQFGFGCRFGIKAKK